ncbi:hypothetical protein PVK06_046610 [Gossypium arboreum]|uniref:Uncharacterized protein n=1 Tax=Gossypium arboreum TaxID=29729 RepID=A0ABR0MBH3_GOSAR|nr:hypothetical protein PVK06_046610 [Gossypium arboreum]
MTYMDSDGKHDREGQSVESLEESFASSRYELVQELEVNAVLPALGSNNPVVGTKVLTRVVREVLEKVFEASLERNRELVQGGVCGFGEVSFLYRRVDTWTFLDCESAVGFETFQLYL